MSKPPRPLVLAIEPDPKQAAALKRIATSHVRAQLVLADSKDAAIAAIDDRIPDLILVTALLSPRDEGDLLAHLRTVEAHDLQLLTIPQIAQRRDAPRRSLLWRLSRRSEPRRAEGCDPAVFGDQIRAYLEHVRESRELAGRPGDRREPGADAPEAGAGETEPRTAIAGAQMDVTRDEPPSRDIPAEVPPAEAPAPPEPAEAQDDPVDEPPLPPAAAPECEIRVPVDLAPSTTAPELAGAQHASSEVEVEEVVEEPFQTASSQDLPAEEAPLESPGQEPFALTAPDPDGWEGRISGEGAGAEERATPYDGSVPGLPFDADAHDAEDPGEQAEVPAQAEAPIAAPLPAASGAHVPTDDPVPPVIEEPPVAAAGLEPGWAAEPDSEPDATSLPPAGTGIVDPDVPAAGVTQTLARFYASFRKEIDQVINKARGVEGRAVEAVEDPATIAAPPPVEPQADDRGPTAAPDVEPVTAAQVPASEPAPKAGCEPALDTAPVPPPAEAATDAGERQTGLAQTFAQLYASFLAGEDEAASIEEPARPMHPAAAPALDPPATDPDTGPIEVDLSALVDTAAEDLDVVPVAAAPDASGVSAADEDSIEQICRDLLPPGAVDGHGDTVASIAPEPAHGTEPRDANRIAAALAADRAWLVTAADELRRELEEAPPPPVPSAPPPRPVPRAEPDRTRRRTRTAQAEPRPPKRKKTMTTRRAGAPDPNAPARRLKPLAVWAHRTHDDLSSVTASVTAPDPAQPGRREIWRFFDSRGLPPHLAGVSYASGCRIRRIRVPQRKARPRRSKRSPDPIIIVSRRALAAARQAAAAAP